MQQPIRLKDGRTVSGTYVRHLGTATPNNSCGGGSMDRDLYLLADGREIVATSPTCDGRAIPQEEVDRVVS